MIFIYIFACIVGLALGYLLIKNYIFLFPKQTLFSILAAFTSVMVLSVPIDLVLKILLFFFVSSVVMYKATKIKQTQV
jgi:hypothetical protein